MKSVHQWLDEYGESHQNGTNKVIHWICVPAIFLSITGLLYGIKLPFPVTGSLPANGAMVMLLLVTVYYCSLSWRLGAGMLVFGLLCLSICYGVEQARFVPLWLACLVLFALAWVGQFYGHGVEGKKPSFFRDVQFLLIGPMWIMGFIYRKLGIPF